MRLWALAVHVQLQSYPKDCMNHDTFQALQVVTCINGVGHDHDFTLQ